MKKQQVIIVFVSLLVVIGLISLLFFYRNSQQISTGGSGKPQLGYLVLRGYDSPSNTRSKIPVGEFFSVPQETKIRNELEGLLNKEELRQEYTGYIVPETVDVRLNENTIQFNVAIENPKTIYTVLYNSLNNKMSVSDENGTILLNLPGETTRPIQ